MMMCLGTSNIDCRCWSRQKMSRDRLQWLCNCNRCTCTIPYKMFFYWMNHMSYNTSQYKKVHEAQHCESICEIRQSFKLQPNKAFLREQLFLLRALLLLAGRIIACEVLYHPTSEGRVFLLFKGPVCVTEAWTFVIFCWLLDVWAPLLWGFLLCMLQHHPILLSLWQLERILGPCVHLGPTRSGLHMCWQLLHCLLLCIT